MTQRKPNLFGVTLLCDTEDFADWEWGDDIEDVKPIIAKISCDAARVVMQQIAQNISIHLGMDDGIAVIQVLIFEGDVMFQFPLAEAVQDWRVEEVAEVIAALENALAKIKAAV